MLAEVVSPLLELLEKSLRGVTRGTKRAASSKAISKARREDKCEHAWKQSKILLQECVTLAQPRKQCSIMVSTYASDPHWGGMITQVPDDDLFVHHGDPAKMCHEPLAFLSGSFRGSQLRWPTLDKEASAIVK